MLEVKGDSSRGDGTAGLRVSWGAQVGRSSQTEWKGDVQGDGEQVVVLEGVKSYLA